MVVWRTVLAWRRVETFTRTDTRIDGILYGLMLAMLYHQAPERFRRMQSWSWAWVGVIAASLAYFRLNPQRWWRDDVEYMCADAMGVALLLLLYRQREGRTRPAIYRAVAWVGLYSYGIYLWHVSVIAPLVTMGQRLPHPLGKTLVAFGPAFGIALGVLTTKSVEFPALRLRDRLYPRKVDSAAGIPAEIEGELDIRGTMESVSVQPQS